MLFGKTKKYGYSKIWAEVLDPWKCETKQTISCRIPDHRSCFFLSPTDKIAIILKVAVTESLARIKLNLKV